MDKDQLYDQLESLQSDLQDMKEQKRDEERELKANYDLLSEATDTAGSVHALSRIKMSVIELDETVRAIGNIKDTIRETIEQLNAVDNPTVLVNVIARVTVEVPVEEVADFKEHYVDVYISDHRNPNLEPSVHDADASFIVEGEVE
jgi:hypothetical protein